QSAETAGYVDRELSAAGAETDGVAEVELGGRRLAGRQIDDLETTRHEIRVARSGARVDREPAGTRPGPDSARDHHAAERREDVVHEVHERLATLDRVGDHPDRPEQARMVLGE